MGDATEAIRAHQERVLLERGRFLLWAVLLGTLVLWSLAASGVVQHSGQALAPLNSFELGVFAVALTLMGRPWWRRHILVLSVAMCVQGVAFVGLYGLWTGNVWILALRLITLSVGASALLPWGTGAQGVLAATSGLAFAIVHWHVNGSLDHPSTIQTLVLIGFSVPIAFFLKRAHTQLASEMEWRKTTENALRESLANTERRVFERTAALAELARSLEAAKAAAEKAHQAKDQFLANMSHEMRTPLNVIIGMTDMRLNDETDPEHRAISERVRKSAEQLSRLINDLFDLSVVQMGHLSIQCVPFNLAQLVEETAAAFAAQASDKGIAYRVDIAPDAPGVVEGDPDRIRQVLANLLGNAFKFTNGGEIVLHVGQDAPAGSRSVRFEVRDTGIGIAPEHQATIFAPFTQVDMSDSRAVGGAGLGLAICKQLVALMNGSLGMHSELGRGSTFWFSVPLVPAQAAMRAAG
jgi:signal transduction histidine kinase